MTNFNTQATEREACLLADHINSVGDGYHYTVNPELACIVIGPRAFYLLDWAEDRSAPVAGTVWAQGATEYDPEEVQAQGYWIVQTTAEILATSALPA